MNDDDWESRAECSNPLRDPDDWHANEGTPDGRRQVEAALRVCNKVCTVRDQCLAYALDNDIEESIWGGMTSRERKRLARR